MREDRKTTLAFVDAAEPRARRFYDAVAAKCRDRNSPLFGMKLPSEDGPLTEEEAEFHRELRDAIRKKKIDNNGNA